MIDNIAEGLFKSNPCDFDPLKASQGINKKHINTRVNESVHLELSLAPTGDALR